MEQLSDTRREKVVNLSRGMFVVRYASAEDVVNPPRVNISLEPGSERHVSLILHPDSSEATLWQPGACLVVRATNPARLSVEVVATQPNSSTAATVKLEALVQGESAYQSLDLEAEQSDDELDLQEFRLLGHVAGRGDVVAGVNHWIAGPTAPSRLEGLAIEWPDRPGNIDIRYAVKFGRPNPVSSPVTSIGGFVGTRGRAQPIVGAMFEISGAGASQRELVIDALFLGSPTLRSKGKRVLLSGPTGREPLVGLRFDLVDLAQAQTSAGRNIGVAKEDFVPKRAAAAPKRSLPPVEPAKPQAATRLRVFRSASKPTRSKPGR